MSIWSEIRPPRRDVTESRGGRLRAIWSFRRAIGFAPLGLAVIAALMGLAAIAHQQSTADQPLIVESVDLPTASEPSLIDLNTATVAELATLPGVGETRAKAIIVSRERFRFTSLADLFARGILSPTQLAAIAEQAAVDLTFD